MNKFGFAAVVAALALGGCGGSDVKSSGGTSSSGTENPVSCNFASQNFCAEVSTTSLSDTQVQAIQSACTSSGNGSGGSGTYSTSGCSTSSKIGTCAWTTTDSDPGKGVPAGLAFKNVYYSPISTADAQTNCAEMGGTFTAG